MTSRQGFSLLTVALQMALQNSPGGIVSGPGPTHLMCPAHSSNGSFWRMASHGLLVAASLSRPELYYNALFELSQH